MKTAVKNGSLMIFSQYNNYTVFKKHNMSTYKRILVMEPTIYKGNIYHFP